MLGIASENRGSEFFQHAPRGKIVGVDLNGDAFERDVDVTAYEIPVLRKPRRVAIDEETRVGKLLFSEACVEGQGADTAVHVQVGVLPGRAVARRNRMKLVEVLVQHARHLRHNGGALGKAHLSEARSALGTAIVEHGVEIDALAGYLGDRLSGHGMTERPGPTRSRLPLAGRKTL